MTRNSVLYILFLAGLFSACSHGDKRKDASLRDFTFAPVKNIRYEEVKRRFSSGLSVNEMGFHQEPSWIIEFISDDSVLAYYPKKKIMQGFHLHYDHANVYNFAKEWFRVKKIAKDSLVLQRLQVNRREIASDITSDVNMTFYAQSFIKRKLRTTARELQKPTAADSAFVRKLAERSNRNPGNRDSAFAARQPVRFVSRSPLVLVEQISNQDPLTGKTASYDYMFPEYKITIRKAYKDFAFRFGCVIDARGTIHIGRITGVIPEYYEQRKKVIEGVIRVYLRNLSTLHPGTTFGIPHSSEITLNITGKADN
ncbi:hypothetical protein C7T94_02930 [Pedobacter yulinensis]|uniref:Uncharacterized protein n=1 Tax=Pedobacter yulinensis TaxID=2126353 RepID=A0A2T3HRQ2_9SPHI|nr:hypothetical protein [Pedobacter yulinensis]PST85083.1 hypothetical protein C7T94_02930 [Pedobacter yulinensis]